MTVAYRIHLWESVHLDSELALQQIEAQNPISLSRNIGTPNISSKSILEHQAVSVPLAFFPPGHHHRALLDKSPAKKLIEEIAGSPTAASNELPSLDHSIWPHSNGAPETPSWTWGQEGGQIRITIQVPKLVRS